MVARKSEQLKHDIVTALAAEHYTPPEYLTSDNRIMRDRNKVVRYARKSIINNPLYQRLVNIVADYVLGADGVELLLDRPEMSPKDKTAAAAAWRSWCMNCDARGEQAFTSLEREIVREVLNVGEVLVVINPDKTLSIVQTENIVKVNTDTRGRALSYVVRCPQAGKETVKKQLPAADCVYLYNKPEPNATRGVGFFWSAFVYLFYVDNMLKSASKSAAEAAKWVAVLTTAAAANIYTPAANNGEGGDAEEDIKGEIFNTEAGMIFKMKPGENAQIFNNPKPEKDLETGLRPFLKLICSAAGIPVDLVLADYSNQSYSSSKSLSLHLQMTMSALASDLIYKFYKKIFRRCVGNWDVDFAMPQMQTIDAYKEAQADALKLDSGLSTLTQTLKSRNVDFAEMQTVRADELALMWQNACKISESTGGAIPPAAIFSNLSGIDYKE